MGFFTSLKSPDINQGIREYQAETNAVLLDVRTPQEYREGHIPGSVNLPLQTIDKVTEIVENMSTPLFVYCLSGSRSRQAAESLKEIGYPSVKNIGGIGGYFGKVVQ